MMTMTMSASTNLHLTTQSDITDDLLEGLENREIVSLRLSGSVLRDTADTSRSTRLWECLIMNLNESLLYVHLLDGVVPAKYVAALLQNCPEMDILEIGRAQIEGDSSALQDMECCLAEHKQLREFHCMDVDVTFQGHPMHTNMDSFIKSLSLIPTLSVLKIQSNDNSNNSRLYCSKFCLAPLLHCKQLTHLHLGRMPLEEGHFTILSYGVAVSKTLATLALPHTNMTDASAQRLAASCASTSSVLSSIDFACNRIGDAGCNSLAANLALSKAMRSVKLDGNKDISSVGYARLAEMLQENTNIQALEVNAMICKNARVIIDEQLSKNRAEKSAPSAMAA